MAYIELCMARTKDLVEFMVKVVIEKNDKIIKKFWLYEKCASSIQISVVL